MPKTKQIIITGSIRLRLDPQEHEGQRLDAKELAQAARQWMREQIGTARISLQAPRPGRGEERDGEDVTPCFVYGNFDFPFTPPRKSKVSTATPNPVTPKPAARARKAATGATKRLAATGATRKLSSRKVRSR